MSSVQLENGATHPVPNVWCFGRTFAKHAAELGNPVPADPIVFLKPTTALRGLAPAPVAFEDETFDHECELVLRVGRAVPLGTAPGWDVVDAVGLGLDLTRRSVQSRLKAHGLPWWPAKGFAGSGIVSPLVPASVVGDPTQITFGLEVEGEPRQAGRVRDLVLPIPALLSFLAHHAPLSAGDLVFTGTPEGVGPIRVGQTFRLRLTWPGGARTFDGVL